MANHALFPLDGDGDDDRDISWVQITRWEGGAYKFSPQLIAAEDLAGLEELHQMFGGGQYELIARTADKSRISTRKKYHLPGPPKPLAPTSEGAGDTSSSGAQGAANQGAAIGRSQDPMMALLAMMMAQSQQQSQMMTQVIVAALSQKGSPAPDHTGHVVKALADLATRQQTATGPAGSMDAILKAMEIGQKIGQGNAEGGESGLMETLSQLLHGAMAAQASNSNGSGGPPPS
jgi:hypothetical protein